MSKRTDSELLEITTTLRDSYQPEAVIAAETEIVSRNLTVQQLANAQQLLDSKMQEQEKKNKKLKVFKNITSELADTFNPQKENSTDKTIKIVSIGLTIAFIASLIYNWSVAVFMLQGIGITDIVSIEFFAQMILFPIGLFGFWTIRKYGWIILSILFTYIAVGKLLELGLEIKWAMRTPNQSNSGGLELLLDEFESFADKQYFGRRDYASIIVQLILFSGLLIFLNRQAITERYMISRRTQLLVIGLTGIPIMLFGVILFM